jgi:mannosyl-3-phosphoglycerate phosphatase
MNDAAIDALQPFIAEEGLRCLQGDRYFHLTGGHDKGVAVKALSKLYTEEYSRVFTVGIGNARSDTAMIEAVDQPFQADLKTRVNVWKQLEAFVQRVLQHG